MHASAGNKYPYDAPSTIPRTSSWVRNHATAPRSRPAIRKKASRDTFATDYSAADSPVMSRVNSFTIESSARSATASMFDPAPSPVLTDATTSFLSNSNSLTSSPVQLSPLVKLEMPELPPIDPRSGSLAIHTPSENIQDFIRFDPVPPVPPISLPSAADSEFDDGFMLTNEMATISEATTNLDMPTTREFMRESDCNIGPSSTFVQMNGFCKGAEAFRIGGHWQGIKQIAGFVAVSTIRSV